MKKILLPDVTEGSLSNTRACTSFRGKQSYQFLKGKKKWNVISPFGFQEGTTKKAQSLWHVGLNASDA